MILRSVVLSWCVLLVSSVEKTAMYMKRSEISDQSMSGAGYSYNDHDGQPQEYSFELGDNSHALKILEDLGYDPFAESQRYAEENLPLPFEEYTKEYSTTAEAKPIAFLINENSYKVPEATIHEPSLYPHINEYRKLGIYPSSYSHAYPYAAGYHHNNFLKKGGNYYGDIASSKFGEKVDTGYKTADKYSKGVKGSYDNKDAKSFYDKTGGNKHLVFDNAGNYAVKYAGGKASRGGSFGQKDSHSKGSKTTGYHKAYHKDDYNKQHKFYDKADRRGHFKKYGDYNAKNDNSEGRFVKGGHQDQGYENNKYGLSGVSDKGKYDDVAKIYRNAAGDEGYFQDYVGYDKKGGKESGSLRGYSSG